jgi:hypothetical protein
MKPLVAEARCPYAGQTMCGEWFLIGTGPNGGNMYQRNCSLMAGVGDTCIPTPADPQFLEVAP